MCYAFTMARKALSKQLTLKEAMSFGRKDLYVITPCSEKYRGSGLYVLEFDTGVKVGISKNLRQRIKIYKKPWEQKINFTVCFKTLVPIKFELLLKQYFQKYTKKGSSEFLHGVKIETIVKFIVNNEFYRPV